MFPDKVPIVPRIKVRHDPEGGLRYRVDKVTASTDDYETEHALNGLRRVAYTQLDSGVYPAGTAWNKDEAQFRANFTPIGLEGNEEDANPDEYRVVLGSNEPIKIRPNSICLEQNPSKSNDPMPGVHHRGTYVTNEGKLQIVSFLYHKTDPTTGELETTERLVITEGLGYGVHSGHVGQPPSWYIVGPQIGEVDYSTGRVLNVTAFDPLIDAKHFSVACIDDGPLGEPFLADSQQ